MDRVTKMECSPNCSFHRRLGDYGIDVQTGLVGSLGWIAARVRRSDSFRHVCTAAVCVHPLVLMREVTLSAPCLDDEGCVVVSPGGLCFLLA